MKTLSFVFVLAAFNAIGHISITDNSLVEQITQALRENPKVFRGSGSSTVVNGSFELVSAENVEARGKGDEFFPLVPADVQVSLFAQEPLVRNPCAIAFDAKGRLCVGMGAQYRIADVTAFLRGSASSVETTGSPVPARFTVQRGDGQFHILFGGKPVATYLFQHPDLTRPALVNVRTVSGIPVTREFPAPVEADHRWMHPGIAVSFGNLDGNDYWRFKAKVEHAGFLQEPTAEGDELTWTVRNRIRDSNASGTARK